MTSVVSCRYSQSQFSADDIDDLTLSQTASQLEASLANANCRQDASATDGGHQQSLLRDPFAGLRCCAATGSGPPSVSQNGARGGATDQQWCNKDWESQSHSCYPTIKDEPTILLTAPTGKAAQLLGDRTQLPAFTLHQVAFSYDRWRQKIALEEHSEDAEKVKWKFRHVRVLVVDESSLVSVSLFSWLLHALITESELQKVVLLGDICQLPSIEPGNFLSNVFESLRFIGCSVLLRTNHRAESQRIVDNAGLIAIKRRPVIAPSEHFHQVTLEEQGQNISDSEDDLLLSEFLAKRCGKSEV